MAGLKKDNNTTTFDFHQMKELSDSLTSIGMSLRDEEFISYILAGLGEDMMLSMRWWLPATLPCRSVTCSHSFSLRSNAWLLVVLLTAPTTT